MAIVKFESKYIKQVFYQFKRHTNIALTARYLREQVESRNVTKYFLQWMKVFSSR